MAQQTSHGATYHDPSAPPGFELQTLAVRSVVAEEFAAQSVGVMLEHQDHSATAVAVASTAQAAAVQAAMARQHLRNYHLVPETSAALEMLERTGVLGGYRTLVVYDLGSSGVTVSVVDRESRTVLAADRSTAVGGDNFDGLILDQQVRTRKVAAPVDERTAAELAGRCRTAKEQLSAGVAACVPGDGGLILISREAFESLIVVQVEGSARLARQLVVASGRRPDAVVLLGGGAHIPLVRNVLGSWLDLPTVLPAEPESIAAQGAALLARPVAEPVAPPVETPGPSWRPGLATQLTEPMARPAERRERSVSRRQLVVAGAAAGALALVALTGLALGGSGDPGSAVEQPAGAGASGGLPSTTVRPPAPTPSTSPPPPTTTEETPEPTKVTTTTPPPPPPPPPPPRPRYLNLPDPLLIEVPPGMQLPPGMVR
ncbi:Hsp70 family protein [Rhodococcus kronopolitis]|uniref:Hsp70 family protein n=1 Tax=Rhodococcus kronopolitis TaxID=1460226 RepID=A0ABV9FQU2_9NOCA